MISISLPRMPFFSVQIKRIQIQLNSVTSSGYMRGAVCLDRRPLPKEHGFSSTHIYGMNLRQICACLINQQGFHGDGGAGPKNGPGLYAHHDPLTAPCVNTFRGKRDEWETHLQGLQGGNTVQHPTAGTAKTTRLHQNPMLLLGPLEDSHTSYIILHTVSLKNKHIYCAMKNLEHPGTFQMQKISLYLRKVL